MEVILTGPYVLSQCSSECSLSGPKKNYLVTSKTSCTLILRNMSNLRCDVRVWFTDSYSDSVKLGTWIIPPNDSVTLTTFPGTLETEPINFTKNTIITVKFFQSFPGQRDDYHALSEEDTDKIYTFTLNIQATRELITLGPQNYDGWGIPVA